MSVPLSITLTILLGSVLLAASSSVTPISTIAVAPAARDICSSDETGFKKGSAEAGVACYVGNFLVKAMTELNQGSEKTAEHVRIHMLPYLGGYKGIDALLHENIHNEKCQICFMSDYGTASGLRSLRLSLTDDQLAAYDSQKPCFHTLANRIMSLMPTDREGLFLLPSDGAKPDAADNAFDDTVDLLKDLFDNDKYDAASCVKNPSSS